LWQTGTSIVFLYHKNVPHGNCVNLRSGLWYIFLYSVLQGPFGRFMQRRRYKTFLKLEEYYRNIVSAHLPYFRRLTAGEQHKLLFRSFLINRSKKFHYVGIEKKEEMPVLISAVAAQLTLGLENSRLIISATYLCCNTIIITAIIRCRLWAM